jgi:hypothetical protein
MAMIPTRPDNTAPEPGTLTVPADGGWAHGAETWITGPTGTLLVTAVTAAILGALAAYLITRRTSNKTNISRHLMYLPLLLVNAAAVYGQVAFFYESVAPAGWPILGKLALSILIAAAIESIAVYVGWHAHDALLMKASATAARLRRASYLLALLVGAINYAHFAGTGFFDPTAASVAFGLLSLLSPWLWGLHTRRAQHVQLTKEGAIDVAGATFSAERIWAFPVRAYLARRWSIDHYVTDPREAWDGYNADLARARAVKPGTRLWAAWMVLAGHADIEPGVVPTRRPGKSAGKIPGAAPGAHPDARPVSGPGAHPAIGSGTATGAGNGVRPGGNSTRNGAGKPARPPTPRRAPQPGNGRTSQPTSAQLKAFKIRAATPGITWAQLAAKVGVNERTVRRWFEAARPASEPEERASMSTPVPAFTLPRTPVLVGVNGHALTTTEETNR